VRAVTSARRHRRGLGGQALVEFALAGVLLVTLVCGTGQVGAIVFTQLNVDNASRDAARIASQAPDTSGAYTAGASQAPYTCPTTGISTNPACNAAWNAAGQMNASNLTVTIATASPPSGPNTCPLASGKTNPNTADGYISVSVSTHAPIFVPFVDRIFTDSAPPGSTNGTRTLTSTTVMRVAPCAITNGN
jgi:Flp pilus assembly protein TadG